MTPTACCWNRPPRGAALSVPALPGHPELALPADRASDLAMVLKSASVTRAHIHHLMSMDLDVRALLHRLGVPFDVTVHDYFAICPQVNLLPWLQGAYCGEPDIADCNACIANRSSYGSRDIVSWRRGNAWQFIEAERVFCPSEDVRRRLARYRFDRQAIVVPHEPVTAGPWPMSPSALGKGRALRVAVIGVLANQKGAVTVMTVAAAADPAELSHPRDRLRRTGAAGAAGGAHRDDRRVRRSGAAGAARQGEAACRVVSRAMAGDLQLHADRRDRCRPADRRHADRRIPGTAGGTDADLAGRSGGLGRGMAGGLRRGARRTRAPAQTAGRQAARTGSGLLSRALRPRRGRARPGRTGRSAPRRPRSAWW